MPWRSVRRLLSVVRLLSVRVNFLAQVSYSDHVPSVIRPAVRKLFL